ncbi:MAG: tetratricopeptide repeat protein, partial [Halochromatium sp.]
MPSRTATSLTRCVLILVGAALATAASAKEYAPAKADVIRAEGDPMNGVYVIANHMDEVTYSTDPDGANRARLKRKEVVEIDYDLRVVSTTSYLQALGQASRGNWDKAAEGFLSSTDKARFEWVAVDALFRAAEAQAKLGKHEAAAETLEQVYIRMPKQWRVIEAMNRRGEILLAGGKFDQANKAFALLLSRASDFGRMCDPCEATAMRKGLFGQAMV